MNELTQQPNPNEMGALTIAAAQREVAEVQSQMMLAKQFPRNYTASLNRILNACTRPKLAEAATYVYSRGGQQVTGPSIRLAEAIAQNWGNITCGVRELEQKGATSTCEAFAWDVESNTRISKTFVVKHIRVKKSASQIGAYETKVLTDPRDIYELVANNGARRLRACILGVVPGDVIDEALQQCERTLTEYIEVTPEAKRNLVTAFEKFNVTLQDLQEYLQCNIEAVVPQQIARLRNIYQSIKDGIGKPEDYFKSMSQKGKEKEKEESTEKPKVTDKIVKAAKKQKKAIEEASTTEEQSSMETSSEVFTAESDDIESIM